MGEYHAPQWVDFDKEYSPQLPMRNYFDMEHMIHGRNVGHCDSTTEDVQPNSISENSLCIYPEAQHDLDIIKNTPVKVISPKYLSKEKVAKVEVTTYDEVLGDAMRKLELCQKSVTRDIQNKIAQGLHTNAFKTPNLSVVKSSKSVGFHSVPNKRIQGNSTPNILVKVNKSNIHTPQEQNNTSVSIKKSSVNCSLFKEDKNPVCNVIIKKESHDDDLVDNVINKESHNDDNVLLYDKKDQQEVQYDKVNVPTSDNDKDPKENIQDVGYTTIEKRNKTCKRGNSLTVLPWYNRKRSFNKCKTSSNYVGLAEAALRFQNETPKRFRTRSIKDTTLTNLSKLNRLKPTIPISPALISKNRTRAVTVLSQEEREKQEMEERKKHPIKANPIPLNVLKGPRITKTSTKKATAVTARAPFAVTLGQCKNSTLNNKASTSKNTVTKVLVTGPDILVEHEQTAFFGIRKDITTKTATRVVPFSFEARNKDLQIKKEQRLKNLQETNNIKKEFHATPVPNFLKHITTSIKKQNEKKVIHARPFSFEERNKNLLKKKDELMKHIFEDEKKLRLFRANPIPVFKSVIVRGTSKEHLLSKDKTVKIEDENIDKCDNQENKEPNTIALKPKMDSKQAQKGIIDKQNVLFKVKQNGNKDLKNMSLKLNTDKRAKERREFDEKIKCKELDEETKRLKENKEQLEHEKLVKAEIRKLAEVKARPMPIYKPLRTAKATKILTTPQSPAFASKHKLKQT